MHPFAIRADPGGTITDTPFIFSKTLRADLKPTGAAPAKGFFFFAAMTCIPVFSPPPPFRSILFGFFCAHCIPQLTRFNYSARQPGASALILKVTVKPRIHVPKK